MKISNCWDEKIYPQQLRYQSIHLICSSPAQNPSTPPGSRSLVQPGLLLQSPGSPVATQHLRQRAARLLRARAGGGVDSRDGTAAARLHQWQAQGAVLGSSTIQIREKAGFSQDLV